MLSLKPGASYKSVSQALLRFKKQLDQRHLEANTQLVSGDQGEIYVSVDLIEINPDLPTRRLVKPQHVAFRSEQPITFLAKLHERLDLLEQGGRPVSEEIRDGLKYYSDEPCNQIVQEIRRFAPEMRKELIAVVDHDPNSVRRETAIELLNWSGEVPDTAFKLLPALDDSDFNVRAMVVRYLFPRFGILPADFPYAEMADAFARQLRRPSHQDRSKALYALLALSRKRPELIGQIKDQNEAAINALATRSVIPSIKEAANELIKTFQKEDNRRRTTDPVLPSIDPVLPGTDSVLPRTDSALPGPDPVLRDNN